MIHSDEQTARDSRLSDLCCQQFVTGYFGKAAPFIKTYVPQIAATGSHIGGCSDPNCCHRDAEQVSGHDAPVGRGEEVLHEGERAHERPVPHAQGGADLRSGFHERVQGMRQHTLMSTVSQHSTSVQPKGVRTHSDCLWLTQLACRLLQGCPRESHPKRPSRRCQDLHLLRGPRALGRNGDVRKGSWVSLAAGAN
jgi:hypothetical protein